MIPKIYNNFPSEKVDMGLKYLEKKKKKKKVSSQ